VIFGKRISPHSGGWESVQFWDCRNVSLLFADIAVLLASRECDLQHTQPGGDVLRLISPNLNKRVILTQTKMFPKT